MQRTTIPTRPSASAPLRLVSPPVPRPDLRIVERDVDGGVARYFPRQNLVAVPPHLDEWDRRLAVLNGVARYLLAPDGPTPVQQEFIEDWAFQASDLFSILFDRLVPTGRGGEA